MTPALNALIKYFTTVKLDKRGRSFKSHLLRVLPTLKVYDFSNVEVAIDAIDEHYDDVSKTVIVPPYHNYLLIFKEAGLPLYLFHHNIKYHVLVNYGNKFSLVDGYFDLKDRCVMFFDIPDDIKINDKKRMQDECLRYSICGLYLINRPSGLSSSKTAPHAGNVRKLRKMGVELDEMITTSFIIPRRASNHKAIQYGNKRQVAYHFCRTYYKPSIGREVEYHYKGNPDIAVKYKRKRLIK